MNKHVYFAFGARQLRHRQRSSAGFTLVELTVVIAVIAILATISIIMYSQVQKQSRDSQRDANSVVLQGELEKYFERNGEYPSGCPDLVCTTWFLTENTSSPHSLTAAITIDQLSVILPAIQKSDFGDPLSTTRSLPLLDRSSSSKASYYYFGGTVNNRSYSSSVSYASTATFPCTIRSALNANEAGSYVVGYFSESANQWVLKAGRNGIPLTSSGAASDGCVINKS